MDNPAFRGFLGEDAARDLTQLQAACYLASRSNGRLILKGGLAMRALYRSPRLTKDVDFDADPSFEAATLDRQVRRALEDTRSAARFTEYRVDCIKKPSDGTGRWRLTGQIANQGAVRWVVEVSMRPLPPPDRLVMATIVPPPDYRIHSFPIRAYSAAEMSNSKMSALLSPNRNAPRDLYDLHILAQDPEASPARAWCDLSQDDLNTIRSQAPSAIDAITYQSAVSELFRFLSPLDREAMTPVRWETLKVELSVQIDAWLAETQRLKESTANPLPPGESR